MIYVTTQQNEAVGFIIAGHDLILSYCHSRSLPLGTNKSRRCLPSVIVRVPVFQRVLSQYIYIATEIVNATSLIAVEVAIVIAKELTNFKAERATNTASKKVITDS